MDAATSPADVRSRRSALALLLALAAGALFRVLQYGVGRSLWLDEALLSLNVTGRGAADLLTRPLDYGQTAPPGFLLLQKLGTAALGTGEYALRLVPLLAGLAALFWLPTLARRYVSPAAVPWAAGLFALAPFLVYYASEAKPYALDVLAAVAVLATVARLRDAPDARGYVLAAVAGALAVWVSQPAVFVLAGVGVVLLVESMRAGDRARTVRMAAVCAAWAAAWIPAFLLARGGLADAAYMRAFWQAGFPDGIAWWPRMIARVFREPFGVFGEDPTPLSAVAQAAALAAFALGTWRMARGGRASELALLTAPAGMALVAAVARQYPFGADYTSSGRVLLFLLPSLVLVAAEGVAAAGEALRGTAGMLAAGALGAAMLAPGLVYAVAQVPHLRAEVKPVLAYAAENRQPGDVLYVHYAGRAPFRYYADRYGWTPANSVVGRCAREDPRGYLPQLQALDGRRVWMLFIDDRATSTHDDRGLMTAFLDHLGRRVDDQVSVGAAVYLYDLRMPPAAAGPFSAQLPTRRGDASLACRGPWQNDAGSAG